MDDTVVPDRFFRELFIGCEGFCYQRLLRFNFEHFAIHTPTLGEYYVRLSGAKANIIGYQPNTANFNGCSSCT